MDETNDNMKNENNGGGKSTSESGHAIVVANMEDLTSFCDSTKTLYNPAKSELLLQSLLDLSVSARAVMKNYKIVKVDYDNAINARADAFAPLRTLATEIMNLLKSFGASEKTLDDARGINYKIQGKRVGKLSDQTDNKSSKKNNSVSQQSMDRMIDHYQQLLLLLENESTYSPHEPEMNVVGLDAMLKGVIGKNSEAITATSELNKVRALRDQILYAERTGVVDIALAVKAYVKGTKALKPRYKEIAKLSFKRRK
jgi:hypothetical protein